jgi:outer membrane protein assembly factor BamB
VNAIVICLALLGAAPDDKVPALPIAKAETIAMPGGELLWPQFRGPGGEGHVTQTGLPLEWSETKNIAWKAPIEGLGWSSAVIQGDQVWLTTAVELPMPEKPAEAPARTAPAPATLPASDKPVADDAPAPKPAPKADDEYPPISLRALCYDRNTGKLVHDVEIFKIDNPGRIHKKNSHASPTPVIEGNRLYLHFGKHGTACITSAGEIVWKTQELKYEHRHGPGGSPVIYQDLLLLSCDGTDVQYVVGLDKNTGKIRWKQDRKGRMAYTTPLLVTVDGEVQLISSGGDAVIAYEPTTGKEIWRCAYDGYSLVPRPVIAHGMVFICTGYDNPQVYAVKLGGKGDVTETHVAWKIKKPTMPRNASPLVIGDELYLVNDAGIVSVLDAKTGEEHYHERIGGNFSASPLLVDGQIYLLDEDGKTTVIAPGKEYKVVAENQLDGRSLASLSVAGKAFYLRTDHFLYRIENK